MAGATLISSGLSCLGAAAGILIAGGSSCGSSTGPGAEIENIGLGGSAGKAGGDEGAGLVGLIADLSGGARVRLGGSGVVARGLAGVSLDATFRSEADLVKFGLAVEPFI